MSRQRIAGRSAVTTWVRRVSGAALVLACMCGIGLAIYLYRAMPILEGIVPVVGLTKSVTISRDAYGIPTIKGQSMEDVAFGLGFVHAQDRLWQLEMHRRIASGRLAEALGPDAVGSDQFIRTLNVPQAAKNQWRASTGELRSVLAAYAAGVNEFTRHHMQARPPEFVLLGIEPGEWTPEDSLGWSIMMAWQLGGNMGAEMSRLALSKTFSMGRIQELLPPYPEEEPLATADYPQLYADLFKRTAPSSTSGAFKSASMGDNHSSLFPHDRIRGLGSNSWVLDGSHTEGGMPLLANDPHLELESPSLWYLARLEGPDFKVAGATIPGFPMVVLGQNEHIAWGFTNTGADVQDLYLEQIDPKSPARYRTPSGWDDFATRQEIIHVKGASDRSFAVRSTRHGPVMFEDASLGGPPDLHPGHVLAMRWTALDPNPGNLVALMNFARARTVHDFIDASASYVAPMQNMSVADDEGHIGFVVAGRLPVRKPDNDLKGLAPAPGWDERYDWLGYLPADQLPREIDPVRGWIATANNRIHDGNYPHFVTSEWGPPDRFNRIEQLLASKAKYSPDDMRNFQADVHSLACERLMPFLRRATSAHPLAAAAKSILNRFDCTMRLDQAGPLIFHAWVQEATVRIFADEFGGREQLAANFDAPRLQEAFEGVLSRNDAWWCDDKTTKVVESCEQVLNDAFSSVLEQLQHAYGTNVNAWRWGDAHKLRTTHIPFSNVPALAWMFQLTLSVPGDASTVNAFQEDANIDGAFPNEVGPSMRAIYDLGDPQNSRLIQSTGQSALPWSSNYRNFFRPWSEVRYLPLWATEPPFRVMNLIPR